MSVGSRPIDYSKPFELGRACGMKQLGVGPGVPGQFTAAEDEFRKGSQMVGLPSASPALALAFWPWQAFVHTSGPRATVAPRGVHCRRAISCSKASS
ncbi:unnamed protein product [Durusdinium trenchii]|uniref:Uncharacterized protein n=1 Tax=Durusdinium trenchii TaxID=1381693 RepID=A0ABP0HFX9_9DINO